MEETQVPPQGNTITDTPEPMPKTEPQIPSSSLLNSAGAGAEAGVGVGVGVGVGAVVMRTLDGDPAGDEFAREAADYRILLDKIDALLERLELDA